MRTDFENALATMIGDQWHMLGDGDVESPTGFFGIVEITGTEKAGYSTDDAALDLAIASAEPGFYFVREDSDGNIFTEHFTKKDDVLSRFAQYSKTFYNWMTSECCDDCASYCHD